MNEIRFQITDFSLLSSSDEEGNLRRYEMVNHLHVPPEKKDDSAHVKLLKNYASPCGICND